MVLNCAPTELRRPRVRSIAGELSKAPSGPGAGGTLSAGPALDRGGRLTISSAAVAMSDPPLMAWSGRSGHLGFAVDQRLVICSGGQHLPRLASSCGSLQANVRRLREPPQKGIGDVAQRSSKMSRGDIGLGDERPLFTLGGRRLRRAAQHVTRDEVADLLPQRREDTVRHLRMFF